VIDDVLIKDSIVKGVDGRFHRYVSMGLKESGKRDRRHVASVKRADVVRRVRELEEQRDAGIRLAGGRTMTVEQWLEHWLTAIAVRRLRPKTYENYSCNVRRHLVRLLGHHRLDRLQPEHVEAAWGQLSAEGLAPATVLLNHRILSRALTLALQRGRVAATWPRWSTHRPPSAGRCSR
jgi:integrase